jgi:hypothetical protein
MSGSADASVGAALRAALGADRCARCDDAVLDYVASVLEDFEWGDSADAALEAVGEMLVRTSAAGVALQAGCRRAFALAP